MVGGFCLYAGLFQSARLLLTNLDIIRLGGSAVGRLAKAGGFAGFASFAFLASGCIWVWHIHNAVAIKCLTIPMCVPPVL